MKFSKILKLMETPFTDAMHLYRAWADEQPDEFVTRKSTLFKYGKAKNVPINIMKEIADTMLIDINDADWQKYENSIR